MYPSIPPLLLLLLSTFIIFILSIIFLRRNQSKDGPPGPPALPVIGNLHMLGKLPHRTLEALAHRYGPIMSLRLGQVPHVVVSSSEAAEDFLKAHDAVFASRPRLEASKYFGYGSKGLAFSEYGPYWRYMRKVCTLRLLTASKVDSFAPLRKRELELAVKSLQESAAAKEGEVVVDLSEVVHNVVEEIVYKMVLGSSKHDEFDLKGLIQSRINLTGFDLSIFR